MSVYVGIDVHRKRRQVAVVNEGGEVLANRNVPNGAKPILSVIGALPAGTPAAYEAAFTETEAESLAARRPYDLRHACVSTWLNATGDPPQVAEWAGHSVNVLMQVYAKCISGRQEANKRRIFDATRPLRAPDPPDPTDSGA